MTGECFHLLNSTNLYFVFLVLIHLLLVLSSLCACSLFKVKYLGGITFLLKDRCPESATQADQERYEQCAANEILHVSSLKFWLYEFNLFILTWSSGALILAIQRQQYFISNCVAYSLFHCHNQIFITIFLFFHFKYIHPRPNV